MSENNYENKELTNNKIDENDLISNESAEEWVAEPAARPVYAAACPEGNEVQSASRPDSAATAAAPRAAAAEAEWSQNANSSSAAGTAPQRPAAGAYGTGNTNSTGGAVPQRPAGSGQPVYRASQGGATPPPSAPARKESSSGKKRSLWWPILLICLALLAGWLGARLQTQRITAKVTDEITSDIQAYMEEAGATVLYRSVNTQAAASGDTAIDVSSVSSLAADSVVEIATEIVSNDIYSWFFSGSNVQQGAGSGVILSEDGYILTCYHVIENANTITVATRDGQTYDAVLVGGDEEEDIAIIKIEAEGLTPAVMGNSADLKVGSPVVAIGNPLGQLGGTVTAGIVSALERQVTIDNHTYTVMQTDAAINEGNSGGGLFNSRGELVGLVNAKASSIGVEGLAFAIPLDNIKDYIEDIVAHGVIVSKVTLGVHLVDITDQRTALSYRVDEMGVYILSVQENSNAAYAGLQSGDRIVTVDGVEVESSQQVIDIIATKQIGDVLEMDIVRRGEQQHLSITMYGPNQDPASIQQT